MAFFIRLLIGPFYPTLNGPSRPTLTTEIREVILSQNIEIQDAAFKGCYNLETLTEQNETLCISELGENAFSGCENLQTCLFVQDAMIKEKTFYGCKELRVVELLNGTDIEESAFEECESLERICPEGEVWSAGELGVSAFSGCSSLQSQIKVSNKTLKEDTFSYCKKLEVVELTNKTDIEESAFEECESLERICPEGEVWIAGELGASAFAGCSSLQSRIKVSNKTLKEDTFSYCKKLEVVELPNKTDIEESAFEECESLERICPEGEVWIAGELGASAFAGCSSLQSRIKVSNKTLKEATFSYCKKLEVVELPNKTDIEESAFEECESLERICPEGEVWIAGELGASAFAGCSSLQSRIKVSNKTLKEATFSYCKKLEVVELLNKTKIEESAFEECERLERICPEGEVWIAGKLASNAFSGCGSLKSVIKITGKSIRDYAFYNCKRLNAVELPNGAKISERAFENCESLKQISQEGEIWVAGKLEAGAFEGCSSLVTPIVVTGKKIPERVFCGCRNLEVVYLPLDIKVSKDAFECCPANRLLLSDLHALKVLM